ncbi:hypothetical protein HJG60_008445 [Phyllostomus discolor]|uniref:Uncharacterized protein n=1 Tax=Phyllostomus discolor TaxID=89673 RepID=A0A833Z1L7_9CHIR|nr:hypothetical protein HJG60_008445 [Phyllostomus discolor]
MTGVREPGLRPLNPDVHLRGAHLPSCGPLGSRTKQGSTFKVPGLCFYPDPKPRGLAASDPASWPKGLTGRPELFLLFIILGVGTGFHPGRFVSTPGVLITAASGHAPPAALTRECCTGTARVRFHGITFGQWIVLKRERVQLLPPLFVSGPTTVARLCAWIITRGGAIQGRPRAQPAPTRVLV